MEILAVTFEMFRNEVIGKTFLFSDDTSVTIDIDSNEVTDMDGMFTVSENKKQAIEKKINSKITL